MPLPLSLWASLRWPVNKDDNYKARLHICCGDERTAGLHGLGSYLSRPWDQVSRNEAFPAVSVKKDGTAISDSGPLNVDFWALRVPRKNKACSLAAMGLPPLPVLALRIWGWGGYLKRCRILAPDSWDAYERNGFSKPRLLYLPIHRRVLNSFIWDIWFSLINNNHLIFRLPTPCCKLPYSLAPPLTSLEFSQGHLRCCFQGLKS